MPITQTIIDEMVETIVREIDPEQIILFGSHARGQASEDSDIDLLIVVREPFGPGRSRREETARIWQMLARFPVAKDILVYSADDIERRRDSVNHVIGRALSEGQAIYERSQ